jgi:hypothetical protein
MPHIALVTPSYGPDLPRCELLAESVARFASNEYRHVVIVPREDAALFRDRVGRHGAIILLQEELLPSWLLRVPFSPKWQLSPRAWPVRGWIRQQVIKIAFACSSTADAVVFADSDTCMVRPFGGGMVLRPGGRVKLFADPSDGDTPVHHEWYRRASRLLGIPVKDYHGLGFIGSLVSWVPDDARALVRHLERVNGGDWRWLLLHQKTFSEYVLYGVFVQEVLGFEAARHEPEVKEPVLQYWKNDQLSDASLLRFVETLGPEHVAVHIQSKASYSFDVYARAVRNGWVSGSAAPRVG